MPTADAIFHFRQPYAADATLSLLISRCRFSVDITLILRSLSGWLIATLPPAFDAIAYFAIFIIIAY
jgi:hypothetical protein